MHVHVGIAELAVFTAYLIVVGFFLRFIAAKNADNALGQALGFIY